MGWGRIDDAFDDHEKVLALLDFDEGIAAIGLWTLCFTWAHRNTRKRGKTPGLLPSTLPRRFVGARGRELAALLVDAGMWDEVDDGWMIHDFADYLPDKEVSAARSEAGKKGAASRWGNRKRDGKLPSGDGKPHGKADGQGVANAASGESSSAAEPVEEPVNVDDGKLPSGDSNLPSDSHRGDGKAVASDGSRAGARRDRVDVRTTVLFPDPSAEPVPPSAGTAPPRRDPSKPINAGDIIAAYMDGAKEAGLPAPVETLRARVGRQARALLADKNIDQDALLVAARNMGAGGWQDLGVQMQRDAIASKTSSGNGKYAPGSDPHLTPSTAPIDPKKVI